MSPDTGGVKLPEYVIQAYGCRGCTWKQFGTCPKGFTQVTDKTEEGICEDMLKFLFELRKSSSSLSEMKEKFNLYKLEMQAMADHSDYLLLKQRYDELSQSSDANPKKLAQLKMAIESYKLWWSNLTQSVVKGLGKIADRESRSKDVEKGATKKISIQNLNVLLKEADKQLIEHGD
jgi:hypothetical protein